MGKNSILIHGTGASEGIAIAKAYVYEPLDLSIVSKMRDEITEEDECARLNEAIKQAKAELDSLYSKLKNSHSNQAKIFLVHRDFLDDDEMLQDIVTSLKDENLTAEYAVEMIFNQYADLLKKVEDPVISGRSADLLDAKRRVLRLLMNKKEKRLDSFSEDVIIVARDLLPSDTANLDKTHVKGIVTGCGGTNSHCAILARSFMLPAILGVGEEVNEICDGELLILDGFTGNALRSFSDEEKHSYEEKRDFWEQKVREEQTFLLKKCVTRDGTYVELGINVGSDEYEANEKAYDFVGLLRTEFLYMENTHMPTEEEQFEAYRHIIEKEKGKCVTLRTLDIGGDKTLPYFSLPKEENPFLGERALRLCFEHPEILLTQLRAVLRASSFGKIQIMFPMVSSIEDIRKAKSMVKTAMEQLDEKRCSYDKNIKIGVMIEVPSLALIADLVAKEVDFASIGSNDLTQYVCAADRMNASVEPYYQTFSPAMLRLLKYIFESFEREGKSVSVCGEMASSPKGAMLLVGLGAKKLSMNYSLLARVKAEFSRYTISEIKDLANGCMKLCTEKDIKLQMEK